MKYHNIKNQKTNQIEFNFFDIEILKNKLNYKNYLVE